MKAIAYSPTQFLVNTFTGEIKKGKAVIDNKIILINLETTHETPIIFDGKKINYTGGVNKDVPNYKIESEDFWIKAAHEFNIFELKSVPRFTDLFNKVRKSIEDEFGPVKDLSQNQECEK